MSDTPESGEVAALIERLHARTQLMVCKRRDGCWVCDDNKLYLETADALARLSAPVPRLASDDVELLQMLIEDCENKYGDPHTLRHAKEVVDRLSAAAPVPATTTIAELQRTVIDYVRSKDPQRLDDWYLPSTHSDLPAPVPRPAAQINPRVTTSDAQDWAVVLRDRFPISNVQRELIAQCLESLAAAPVPARERYLCPFCLRSSEIAPPPAADK